MERMLIDRLNGGMVVRYHTNHEVRRKQTLAEHQWNMAVLLDGFYEGDQPSLAKLQYAIRYHDNGEKVGDLPYLVKLQNPIHAANHKKLEDAELARTGIFIELTDAEANWIKIVDMLEAIRYLVMENGRGVLARNSFLQQLDAIYARARDTNQHDLEGRIATFVGLLGQTDD